MPPLKRVPSSSTLGRAPTASTSVRGAKPPLSSSSNLGRPSTVLGIRSTSGAASSSKGAGSGPSSSHGGATGSADTRERREGEGIKVFVRVRGHASSEPPVTNSILSTAGPRGHQIHVALDQPVVSSASSAAAAAALASDPGQERTYTFDGVFGPDADQGLVYQDVVVPILNDVLNGYKCTIFAYGQTGTGKTHTMEGNLESKGTFHFDAGIIPRTLDRLFHQVEMDKERELSVRATFLELYNEDLRDLLSPDFSAPGASTGIGKGGSSNLKIFESKDGPQVQGVWETPISSAEEGLKLLRQGSERRQVAATNCNDVSSRSHSIFTLTVYTRDTSPNAKDNDLLKVGKLYLVDLAGSESIERSGAKEKGAREAGMINKSLLTLGRVINALVEGSAHVPYRESNLTRLLQDSLGGGHKTSIIATVSQAKSNVEETLSTLDYALRAKSIKNRPELNAKLNRPALVKDLENMVKVLQADLRACIQQSGRYISEENYSRMLSDHDATQRQRDEFKREVEVEKSKVSSIAEQVEHMAQRDVKRQAENTELRSALEKSQAEARSLRKELSAAHSRVEALSESERILFMTAQELQADGARSVADNEGLIAKIARQTSSEKDIFSGIMAYQLSLKSHLSEIENSALVITTSTDSFCQRSSESVSSYAAQRTEEENARKATLQGHAEAINSIMQTLHQQRGSTDGALAQLCDALSSLLGSIAKEGEETLAKYEQSTSQLFSQLSDHLRANRKEVEKAARVSTANADEIVTLVGQHLAQLKGELDDLKARIDNSAKEWKDTLEQQQATEAEEIADWDSGLEQVVEHLVAISRRTKAHREARVTRLIEHAARSAEHRASRLSEVDVIQAECEALWNELDGRQGVLRKGYEEIHSTLKTHERSLKGEMHGLEQTVSNALQDQVSHLARGAVGLQEQLACGEL
ncbi:kinesin-domain-containing protein [Tilletiaria anomala UBC 951]|uniref:Kinesin-like protein n=1 Tax=Tilletiaria anomala (strain ATCC 24038 / CBS 436.72 / UBC 951) TaxID=1037660 RepID=A0A066V644_TILAU|nr:kinesin-domain-containing protein [Tilletiaria anomala UBC 951]KDN37222.1 kinesin-domain-containing protein [Tilletiaria anomala UBC 951]